MYFFKEGFCWTDINSTFLKSRLKDKGIFDVVSMTLFTQTNIPDWFYVTLINTKFISYYVDTFINNTSHFQINDARQLPIIIPSAEQLVKCRTLFDKAFELKNNLMLNDEELEKVEIEIEMFIRNLYRI